MLRIFVHLFLAFFGLIQPVFANDCVNHLSDHLYADTNHEVYLNLDNCNLSGKPLIDVFNYLHNQNLKISHLSLANNQLDAADGINISNLSPLIFDGNVYLNLSHNLLTDAGINAVINIPKLVEIDLTDNQMTDISAEKIGFVPSIKTLILNWNQISDEGCFRITTATHASRLELAHNKIGDGSCAGYLGYNQAIKEFDGSYNAIGNKGATCLGNAPLTKLNLEGNQISDEGAHWLAFSQLELTTLTQLNVANNRITDTGLIDLLSNPNFENLNVANNHISDKGVQDLSKAKSLIALNLDGNHISDKGLAALLLNNRLHELHLSRAQLTDAGIKLLAENSFVTNLTLDSNNITDFRLSLLLKKNNLQTLSLANNQIGSAGAMILASKSGLSSLNLTQNHIFDSGALALASHPFKLLDLSNNSIEDAGIEALLQAHTNGKITSLNVANNPGVN